MTADPRNVIEVWVRSTLMDTKGRLCGGCDGCEGKSAVGMMGRVCCDGCVGALSGCGVVLQCFGYGRESVCGFRFRCWGE